MAGNRGRRGRRRGSKQKSILGLVTTAVILLLVAGYVAVLELSRPHVTGDKLRLDVFVDFAERGKVRSARILDVDSYVIGTYEREDGTAAGYNAVYLKDGRERLVDILLENRIATTVDQQTKKRVANLAAILLPGIIIAVLFVYLILSSRRGTGLFKVRSGARKITPEPGGVTFTDVAGQDAAVAELREIRDFLSDPDRYAALGAQIPKGVLLFGPPGCGKTLLAKALAGEAGASFYSISGSDFVEIYVGVGAARVRDLFQVARENAPAVIFIDELDSIGRARATASAVTSNVEQEQALNQILAEMDGFSTSDGIMVVGATNRPDILDPALLRPGRFDRHIGLERPDESARLAILSIHARGKRLDADVDLSDIARKGIGLTGADLANIMNEAALFAGRAGREAVSQADLELAVKRVLDAPERQRRLAMRERSVGRRFTDDQKVTFADVAGQDAAVAELQEIKEYLADPEKYAGLGARIPRGVLLYGPPGCGKTLLARALASEANAAFFSVGASEFVEVFVGQGASRIRNLFAEARQMAPAIVFIDELDTLGRSRGGVTGDRHLAHGEKEQTLDQFLTELDGFSPNEGVIVVGATNRPDVLDPALLRPGRFDRHVGLELPNEKARLAILSLHAEGKVLGPDVDLAAVADRAHGLTGADLANVMNEAALLAARADRSQISHADVDEALKRQLQAPERQRRLSTRARSIGRRFSADERVTFADVAGVDEAIEELQDIREYLVHPDRFVAMGASPPRGVLLSGPPGCGKTLLARAVAGEANAAFISASATEFVEVFVGEGAARVRDLFADARSMAPTIVFIDEIDAVGGLRRSGAWAGSREVEQTLNQILVELDGFEARTAVIVMAATNRPDMLDPALVRPGRFDRKVEITRPDRAGRRAILELHARSKPIAAEVDFDALAARTQGCSGADLANVLNEAALLATRRGVAEITNEVLDEAIDRAYLGISSRTPVMSEEERRAVAYHEAGHALVAKGVEGAVPPYKLTIVPRASALGHCSVADSHDRLVLSRSMLVARMAVALGGWTAERLVLGQTTSGTGADLQHVRDLARHMVCDLGMTDDLGPVLRSGTVGLDGQPVPSEQAAAAMQRLTEEAHEKARAVLTTQRRVLDRVAEALLERETLSDADLQALLDGPAGQPEPATGRVITNGRTDGVGRDRPPTSPTATATMEAYDGRSAR